MEYISLNNITHKYKGAGEESLKGVSLSVQRGETLLLCGASGSGKTSVIRLINGLIPHYYQGEYTGNVSVVGKDVADTELYELAGVVGTVFQNPRSQFFSVDTDGEIVFGPENIGLPPEQIRQRKASVVERMSLVNLMGRSLFELSGGEKQRIACASVAALLPEIILLDEPSSNLDWMAIERLRETMEEWKAEGKTMVISEHRLWYLMDLVDRVVYLKDGEIAGEWTGEEFMRFNAGDLSRMQLRPTSVEEHFSDVFLGKVKPMDDSRPKVEDGIVLRDFYFSYINKPYVLKKKKFRAEDGDMLSLCIPELAIPGGSVVAVIGRNGTGKSTFLRCVCGLEKDSTGTIEAEGKVYKGKKRIGVSYMVMQDVNHQLFTDSVEAEVMLSMKDKDEAKCLEILENLGLLPFKDAHPMALSGGQKQRVAIASAIGAGAKLLLFDEPTSGLDFAHMEKVGELLKQLADAGKTVLVSTHDPELIEQCCDYELYIENGRVGYFRQVREKITG